MFNLNCRFLGTGLLLMSKNIEKKTIYLAPLPSDWGDINVTATMTTENKKSTLDWEISYPSEMPSDERAIMDDTIAIFMRNQHEDLITMFGD